MTDSMRPSAYHLVEGSLGDYQNAVADYTAVPPSGHVAPAAKKSIQFTNQDFQRSFRFDEFEQAGAIFLLAGSFTSNLRSNEKLLVSRGFEKDKHGTWVHPDGSFLTFEGTGGSVANAGRIRDYDPSLRRFDRTTAKVEWADASTPQVGRSSVEHADPSGTRRKAVNRGDPAPGRQALGQTKEIDELTRRAAENTVRALTAFRDHLESLLSGAEPTTVQLSKASARAQALKRSLEAPGIQSAIDRQLGFLGSHDLQASLAQELDELIRRLESSSKGSTAKVQHVLQQLTELRDRTSNLPAWVYRERTD